LLACACSTEVVLLSTPARVRVEVDGARVADATPYHLKRRRSLFARGETSIRLSASGYRTERRSVRQVRDEECRKTATSTALFGAPLALPLLALLYIPWCSSFEVERLDFTLRPLEPPR
jgi:hypothetical protein